MDRRYDLSVSEVAASLRISTTTIRRYIRDGRMEAYRVGGQWRVAKESIEAFLAGCTNPRSATHEAIGH